MSNTQRATASGKKISERASLLLTLTTALAGLAGCAQTPPLDRLQPIPEETARTTMNFSCDSKPVYPPQALANKVEGESTIGFLIGPDGKVRASRIYKSSGDASLDEAVRSAISKCSFKPALYQGKPVQAWVPVIYVWKAD